MKRSFCLFLLPILVGSARCTTTDNNVGSLGQDAGVVDGPGQDGVGTTLPRACTTSADCPAGLSCGYAVGDGCLAKGVCMQSNSQGAAGGPDYMCGCDGQAILPIVINSTTVLYVSAPYSGWAGPCTGMPDSGVPDAASVGKDAAPASPEVGAAHQCQLNADGTCSAVTSNTACTPFPGNRFDESAGCYSPVSTTLACCATLAGDYCHFAAGRGCYQIVAAGSTVTYWTPGLPDVNVAAPGGQYCDKAMAAKVPGAHPCSLTSPDAGVSDVASVAKDAAPDAPEVGAAHQCQLKVDGTCSAISSDTACCSAITPNTDCTRFVGRIYDERFSCHASGTFGDVVLGCCASAKGEPCSLPAASGCYQALSPTGTVTYWTPAFPSPAVTIPGGQACDPSTSAKVSSAPYCRVMTPTLPAPCTSDDDCCVALDGNEATAYLVGRAEYDAMNASIASVEAGNIAGYACMAPPVQVQCQDGFCSGEEFPHTPPFYSLGYSHCGHIAIADAGTVPPSSATTWQCH